jgi:hypothetical protein
MKNELCADGRQRQQPKKQPSADEDVSPKHKRVVSRCLMAH